MEIQGKMLNQNHSWNC